MRLFALVLSVLLPFSAFAADSQIEVLPAQPLVIAADLQVEDVTYRAPWYLVQFEFKNNEASAIRLNKMLVRTIGDLGQMVEKKVKFNDVVVLPGETFKTQQMYVSNLPGAEKLQYQGQVIFKGLFVPTNIDFAQLQMFEVK